MRSCVDGEATLSVQKLSYASVDTFETSVMAGLFGGLLRWIGLNISAALRWSR